MKTDQLTADSAPRPEPANATPPEASQPTAWGRALGIGLGLAMLVGVLVTAFAWPPAESAPRDIPVAIVGPAEATAQLEQQLVTAMPDALAFEPAADLDAARRLIEDREAYGAIVVHADSPPQVLIASAGSPVVAQMLNRIATQLSQQAAATPGPPVEDVMPLPENDPRGSVFAAAALPMVIGGMIIGTLLSFVVAGVWRRVAGALAAAIAAGWLVTLVTQAWFGALEGNPWANAGAVALTIAAISTTMIGLVAVIGPAGVGVGAVTMFLIGNSLSGVTSAPEMLPTGWGTLGQLLPPGAGGTLLRSTAFFDGAAAAGPVLVLAAWLAGGLVLAALGQRLRPASHQALVR